jgi:DNA-binding transcriptional MerR regulator
MEQYSINDLEKLSGIKASLIRVWERRYSIIKPSRTETNRRRYDDAQLRKIINISILQRNGFKISLIATLTDHEIEEKVAFLSKNITNSDTKIDSLIKYMIFYDERAINDLLVRSILNRGFELTIDEVIFPFLKRIGLMWQTGSADIGSEHFITNIFRQRMILSIDSLAYMKREACRRVILFLPDNELHEIGLLYYLYIIRKLGHETLYLGQTTPLSSVIAVNERWNADIIITGLMSGSPDLNPGDYIRQLSGSFPKQKVLVSGILAEIDFKMNPHNVFPVRSANDIKSLVEER